MWIMWNFLTNDDRFDNLEFGMANSDHFIDLSAEQVNKPPFFDKWNYGVVGTTPYRRDGDEWQYWLAPYSSLENAKVALTTLFEALERGDKCFVMPSDEKIEELIDRNGK